MRMNHQADIVNYSPGKKKEQTYEVLVNTAQSFYNTMLGLMGSIGMN